MQGASMAKGKMTEKSKSGVSVEEIEGFTRKYIVEVFSIITIILATISSAWDFFTGPKLSLFFAGGAAILAVIFPKQIDNVLGKYFSFVRKQERMSQIIIGIVQIIIAIFIPFIIFAKIGFLAGCSYFEHGQRHSMTRRSKGEE